MLHLKSWIGFIFLFLLFSYCKKEYSLEQTSTVAVANYTFNGSAGICTNAVINGTYKTGVALGPSNTVELHVNVIDTGTFSISSILQNGFRFSASGNFINSGNHSVILTGSGTPVSAGVFDFNTSNNGCTFSIKVMGSNSGSAQFTYNGAPGPCTNISYNGNYKTGVPLVASNNVKIDLTVLKPGNYTITTNSINGINFSDAGFFPTIGYQVVTLTGNGTPVTDGNFRYTPSNNGCPFAIVVSP